MAERIAIISGATGVVGHRLAARIAAEEGWKTIGLARRAPAHSISGVQYVEVDLNDKNSLRNAFSTSDTMRGVTHIFSAARFDHSIDQPEAADVNTIMLANLLDAAETKGNQLRHVHLVQGTKYYGSNLGAFRTPARETDPRSLQKNFYFEQEDMCIARSAAAGWSWSASRPHGVCDAIPQIARSLPMVLAVYAAILKELGLPLFFPGTRENFEAIYQCTDATHLANAIFWMSKTPAGANEAFNVTNGDFIRWCNLWPGFARAFGMEAGGVRTVSLSQHMPEKAALWDQIVTKYNLRETAFEKAALWSYADFIFTPHWDMMSDTTKIRRHGFHEVEDTEAMFHRHWDRLRLERIIPPS